MPAVVRSIKFPDLLMEALNLRAKQLGYGSFNSYMLSLGQYDLMVQGEHTLTLPISKATGAQKDKVNAWLLRVVKRGKGARGVLLEHILERMQARQQSALEAILETAADDARQTVMDGLLAEAVDHKRLAKGA